MTTAPTQPVAFFEMPKIARFNREVIVTEKIDGTNASVIVFEDGRVAAGSKNRLLLDSEPDNFGFRAWVRKYEDALRLLGPGLHRGEWWGQGIGRKYDGRPKTFSLFNVQRWVSATPREEPVSWTEYLARNAIVRTPLPLSLPCCEVVPVLGVIPRPDPIYVDAFVEGLKDNGSKAQPGFMRPEGVVCFFTASQGLFKVTCEKDESRKGTVGS